MGKYISIIISFLLLVPLWADVALPSWINLQQNGLYRIDGFSGSFQIRKKGFKKTVPENSLNSKFVEQLSTIELDSLWMATEFVPFQDMKKIRIKKRITVHGSDSINMFYKLEAGPDEIADVLSYIFSIPGTRAGSSLFVDGKKVDLPRKFGKLILYAGKAKKIEIPLQSGRIVLSGNLKIRIQDLRKWNIQSFNIQNDIAYHKEIDGITFEYNLKYSGLKISENEFIKSKPKFRTISLERYANGSTIDSIPGDGRGGWTDQGAGNDLRSFDKVGNIELHGIPFHIADRTKNGNRNCMIAAGNSWKQYRQEYVIPMGNIRADGVYFLHTSAWTPEEPGKYSVHYEDGSSADIPLRNLKEICNWWTARETDQTIIAWRGASSNAGVALNVFLWRNPDPNKKISFIKGSINPKYPQAIMMLLGVTSAEGALYLPQERKKVFRNFNDADWIKVDRIDESSAAGSVLDVSKEIPAPAGKFGFLKVKGEDFVFENGTPARFYGVNIESEFCFPTKEQADFHAKRLRRLGINAVRFHKIDMNNRSRRLIFEYMSPNGKISEENRDRMEYFISKLKENGIYIILDLQTLRRIGEEECPPLAGSLYKSCGMFVPELLDAQKRFITELLTHKNPYTGLSLAEDPALALIIIQNENSMLYQPVRNEIKSPYALKILTAKYNQWLIQRYGNREKLLSVWKTLSPKEDPAKGSVQIPINPAGKNFSAKRFADMRLFWYSIQKDYYEKILALLKQLGTEVPVTGSNHWTTDVLDYELNSHLDYTDRHNYWSHPTVNGSWLLEKMLFSPHPMVLSQTGGIIGTLGARCVLGKPYAVTEWDSASTNEFRADAQLMFPAYSAMHNWHIFQFAYQTRQKDGIFVRPITSSFAISDDPVQLALLPVVTRMFLRGDLAQANNEFAICVGKNELEDPGYDPDLKDVRLAALYCKTGFRFGSKKANKVKVPNPEFEIASETKQLFWNSRKGLARINSPKTQGFVGFSEKGIPVKNSDTEFRITTDFASVVMISSDDLPLKKSRHILLAAVARGWNSGMKYSPEHDRIISAGKLPMRMQPVEGEISFKGIHSSYLVNKLDISGRKIGSCKVNTKDGIHCFRLDNAIYYEIISQGPSK